MKKWITFLVLVFLFSNANATISWMGNHATSAQPNNSQTIHFYVEMYDSYAGCHAEVNINEGGTLVSYIMTQGFDNGNNSTWTADVNVKSNSTAYNFHGWDDYGATVDDNNSGNNYSITINPTTKADGNWNTGSSWCDGSVPTSTSATYVIANNITLDVDVTIGSLAINSGVTFTASDGTPRTLTLSSGGSLTNNGTFTSSTGTISFAGSGTVSGTVAFNDVEINAGVDFGTSSTINGTLTIYLGGWVNTNGPTYGAASTLKYNTGSSYNIASEWNNTPQNVEVSTSGTEVHISSTGKSISGNLTINNESALTVDAGDDLTVNNNLTIVSNSSGTGSLIDNGTLTVSGTTTIQRYIAAWTDASHGWHFLSSPVANQAIQSEFVPNPPTTNEDFYKWDETATSNNWINSKSSPGTWNAGFENAFGVGTGYLVAYSSVQTKSFTGTLNNSDVPISSLTNTTGTSYSGWHLLGNPYPSALYWNKTAWGLSDIDATAKIWVESSASYTDVAAVTGIIPAMQGFMVHVTTAGSTSGSLTIDASDRTHSTTAWYKDAQANTIKLTAYDTEGNTAQESIIKVAEGSTSGFDAQFDSHFLAGYAPQFYSVVGNDKLSTNTLPEITALTTIPFSFIKNNSSTYYIEAEGINSLTPTEQVYLTDLKTNQTQLLNDNPVYYFTAKDGDIAQRFEIHFSALGIKDTKTIQQFTIFNRNHNIEIRTGNPVDATVNVYNITGQLLRSAKMHQNNTTTINMSGFNGVAIVSIVSTKGVQNQKVIIK